MKLRRRTYLAEGLPDSYEVANSGKLCLNCGNFTGKRWCEKWEAYVGKEYTCDSWKAKK